MAKTPTITAVDNILTAGVSINDNFTNVQNAFNNTLSLDGSTPNSMGADLDMNGNNILNVNLLTATNITVSVIDGGTF